MIKTVPYSDLIYPYFKCSNHGQWWSKGLGTGLEVHLHKGNLYEMQRKSKGKGEILLTLRWVVSEEFTGMQ